MLIDAHCHLDQIDDPERAISDARQAGVGQIVCVAQDRPSMEEVLGLRDRHPDLVVAAIGIHPQLIPHMEEAEVEHAFAFLEQHLADADVLGEVGLDYKHATDEAEKARQAAWLERQLELAAAHRKPINLHSRRALRQVMEVAIAYQAKHGLPAQLHWFTQSKKLVKQTNAAGVMISAGPAMLGDPDTLAVVTTIADDCLLFETDCPVPFGGESARPAWIPRLVDALADARGVSPAELESLVEANFARMRAGELPERADA